ncbi:unnamed protein product [Tuber aestivum]|uniref:Uncharacterized protein n=1 Tax=Tuber aestivum TaxID=59557 RepID=A0A292PUI6_9PEZI|nr:unnamed protein product [Tuber aestivum]
MLRLRHLLFLPRIRSILLLPQLLLAPKAQQQLEKQIGVPALLRKPKGSKKSAGAILLLRLFLPMGHARGRMPKLKSAGGIGSGRRPANIKGDRRSNGYRPLMGYLEAMGALYILYSCNVWPNLVEISSLYLTFLVPPSLLSVIAVPVWICVTGLTPYQSIHSLIPISGLSHSRFRLEIIPGFRRWERGKRGPNPW